LAADANLETLIANLISGGLHWEFPAKSRTWTDSLPRSAREPPGTPAASRAAKTASQPSLLLRIHRPAVNLAGQSNSPTTLCQPQFLFLQDPQLTLPPEFAGLRLESRIVGGLENALFSNPSGSHIRPQPH